MFIRWLQEFCNGYGDYKYGFKYTAWYTDSSAGLLNECCCLTLKSALVLSYDFAAC